MTGGLIGKFGYLGIVLLLVLGGLGVPIPEEAPILLSAILSHKGAMAWPLALAACFLGVLLGDFMVYFLGYFYGEKVLSLPLTRKFLTRAREEQIKGYFHRHGIKILIVGRFAVGFRTAAYLTAGILRLPPLRLLLADLFAASLSTLLMFGLGYWFADRIEQGLRDFKHYLILVVALAVVGWLIYQYYKARKRAGQAIGPRVLVAADEAPLPPDDLAALAIRKVPARLSTPEALPIAPPTARPPSHPTPRRPQRNRILWSRPLRRPRFPRTTAPIRVSNPRRSIRPPRLDPDRTVCEGAPVPSRTVGRGRAALRVPDGKILDIQKMDLKFPIE